MECRFCGSDYIDDYDKVKKGYWCGDCDAYNFLDPRDEDRKFTLILESNHTRDGARRSSKFRFNKRLSPLRYPGGKSKVIDFIYHKLNRSNTRIFCEPYCGSAAVGLSLLQAGVIENLILNDVDFGVYALFQTILSDPKELLKRVRDADLDYEQFFASREIVKGGYAGCDLLDAGWHLLLVNRLAFSGIYYANPLGGLNGGKSKLLARWNPDDLCRRISQIHEMRERIEIRNMDACALIEEIYWRDHCSLFIDPPYWAKGKQLYRCYYDEEAHVELNVLLEGLYKGFPGADIILFYDDAEFIEDLYAYPEIEKLDRVFSV